MPAGNIRSCTQVSGAGEGQAQHRTSNWPYLTAEEMQQMPKQGQAQLVEAAEMQRNGPSGIGHSSSSCWVR
jgi:hypothetical protein